MNLHNFLQVLLGFHAILQISSHGNGAPSSRCESMIPGHWVSSQESQSPYEVIIDKTVITPGDRVNITLHASRVNQGFKGFFVMVKDAGDNAKNGNRNYGIFDLATSDIEHAQPVHCFEVRNSAMTHITNDVKNHVELFWIAPKLSDEDGKGITEKELKVVATFVKDFWTIWTDVEPIGEVALILTDNRQPFPTFHDRLSENKNLPEVRHDQIIIPVETSEETGLMHKSALAPVEPKDQENASNSNYFNKAWDFFANLFKSTELQKE